MRSACSGLSARFVDRFTPIMNGESAASVERNREAPTAGWQFKPLDCVALRTTRHFTLGTSIARRRCRCLYSD
jgi:hypothetical protein